MCADVGYLGPRELELVERHLGLLQVAQETEFLGSQYEQRVSVGAGTCCSTHTMNVLLGIIWRIVLDDPVDQRNVETARRHIRAQQYAALGIGELEEGLRAFGLLLLALFLYHCNRVFLFEKYFILSLREEARSD